jgi:hypothetical protein
VETIKGYLLLYVLQVKAPMYIGGKVKVQGQLGPLKTFLDEEASSSK